MYVIHVYVLNTYDCMMYRSYSDDVVTSVQTLLNVFWIFRCWYIYEWSHYGLHDSNVSAVYMYMYLLHFLDTDTSLS